MEELEDEPKDVQNASPVEEEVKKGEIDELSTKDADTAPKLQKSQTRHRCEPKKPRIEKDDCCEVKRQRAAAAQQKTAIAYVPEETSTLVKQEIIPRHCMSKKEYINFLAAPKYTPEIPIGKKKVDKPDKTDEKAKKTYAIKKCGMKAVMRKIRSMPPRIEELAKPSKRRLIVTLEEQATILPPHKLENIVRNIEEKTALTPEQAENYARDRLNLKKMIKKKKHKSKCSSKITEIIGAGDPSLDIETADCQYRMALLLVRSILNCKGMNLDNDYRDISSVVLLRLSEQLEYTPVGRVDRKSQQMYVLADIVACWISGVLLQVVERYKAKIEKECERKRLELEELAAKEALEDEEDDEEDDEDDILSGSAGSLDDEEEDETSDEKQLQEAASLAETSPGEDGEAEEEEEPESGKLLESSTQYEEADVQDALDQGEEEKQLMAASFQRSESEADRSRVLSALELEGEDEYEDEEEEQLDATKSLDPDALQDSSFITDDLVDAEQQTEVQDKTDVETETEKVAPVEESRVAAAKSKELRELEKIASRASESFGGDVPFLNLAKVMETLYCMIEQEAENTLKEPMDNRIHRAIYEKLVRAIGRENPVLLTERTKDVVDVTAGKVAKWLRKTLNEKQIKFLEEHPPAVESREIRDWVKWQLNLVNITEDWSSWIGKMTREGKELKQQKEKLTRGAWQDWTSEFEKNALLWRRAYLETLHQEHRNTMMYRDRKVLKTGTMRPFLPESAINDINFDSASRITELSGNKKNS